jgi:ubiquitin carboxyl-terminal hydrolase 34
LFQCIFIVVGNNPQRLVSLLNCFDVLVPYADDDGPSSVSRFVPRRLRDRPTNRPNKDEPYHYELYYAFERSKAIRSSCGYSGLRNLSNTCYFNSLFTQLFMNVSFRRFMLSVEVEDDPRGQKLLSQTRILFGNLQDSLRRYIETGPCVGSITTFDGPIDIHNQMDVDEFYNLLFDRWETELQGPEAKIFSSFYGGRLVSQIRSKECTHFSERLEPFSAIQCDVKGKTSLQDSLQAYVGGEVMEGGELSKSRERSVINYYGSC